MKALAVSTLILGLFAGMAAGAFWESAAVPILQDAETECLSTLHEADNALEKENKACSDLMSADTRLKSACDTQAGALKECMSNLPSTSLTPTGPAP